MHAKEPTNEFSLKETSVVCPKCNYIFSTAFLSGAPEITKDTRIEADLNRSYPDAKFRAAMVTMCPGCQFTWWFTSFNMHPYNTKLVPQSPKTEYSKLFAHAILCGRQMKAHRYDLALLALEGYRCTAESGKADKRWLELAATELIAALEAEQFASMTAYYHYLLGEIYRKLSFFQKAIQHFDQVTNISRLPQELVDLQRAKAFARDSEPATLPPHLVELLYCSEEELEANSLLKVS